MGIDNTLLIQTIHAVIIFVFPRSYSNRRRHSILRFHGKTSIYTCQDGHIWFSQCSWTGRRDNYYIKLNSFSQELLIFVLQIHATCNKILHRMRKSDCSLKFIMFLPYANNMNKQSNLFWGCKNIAWWIIFNFYMAYLHHWCEINFYTCNPFSFFRPSFLSPFPHLDH